MADKTEIEWTEATWNPVTGCTKVSAGCKHCYAERDWARLQHLPAYAGRAFSDVATHANRLDQPLRWQRPRRIFVNSMSDLFHADVPDDFIDLVFAVVSIADHHTFQVLTKRADRMRQYMNAPDRLARVRAAALRLHSDVDEVAAVPVWPPRNAHLGVSVEDQDAADERIPLLLGTLAAVRWVSGEPLLGQVDVFSKMTGELLHTSGDDYNPGCMDWIVVGGESGPKARPMHSQWARDLRDQCAAAGVPFLFKQWGEWAPKYWTPFGIYPIDHEPNPAAEVEAGRWAGPCEERMIRVGKKAAGRLLDGLQHDGYPEVRS